MEEKKSPGFKNIRLDSMVTICGKETYKNAGTYEAKEKCTEELGEET
jgi:hypothetical protein